MIRVTKITKTYKTDFWAKSFYALKEVSFEIGTGQLVGFLGANGAGKTTFFKIMMGFVRQNSGEVHFDASMGISRKEIFSNIGFLPERPYFHPHLKGIEFLEYMAGLQSVRLSSNIDLLNDLASKLKIDHALKRKVSGYSKGMLQRLGFLSVLLHDPKFIILDEPLSGLDPVGRKEFKDILVALNKQGKTILFSSHIVSDVEEICNDVVLLDKGSLIYQGGIDNIIKKHINPKYFIKVSEGNIPDQLSKYYNNEMGVLEVPPGDKEGALMTLINNGCHIGKLYQDKLTLEEVVYKLR